MVHQVCGSPGKTRRHRTATNSLKYIGHILIQGTKLAERVLLEDTGDSMPKYRLDNNKFYFFLPIHTRYKSNDYICHIYIGRIAIL